MIPGPQHSHSIRPSGVAPRCGYFTFIWKPAGWYCNAACASFAFFRYSSLAVASFFTPQSIAGILSKQPILLRIISSTREAGGGFRDALLTAANFDAVIRPAR